MSSAVQAELLKTEPQDHDISIETQDDSGTAEHSINQVIHLKHNDEQKEGKEEGEGEEVEMPVAAAELSQQSESSAAQKESDLELEAVEVPSEKAQQLKEELKSQADEAPLGTLPAPQLSATPSAPAEQEEQSTLQGLEEKVENMEMVSKKEKEAGGEEASVESEREVPSTEEGTKETNLEAASVEEVKESSLQDQTKVDQATRKTSEEEHQATTSTSAPDNLSPESPSTPKVSSTQLPQISSSSRPITSTSIPTPISPEPSKLERQRTLPPPPTPSKESQDQDLSTPSQAQPIPSQSNAPLRTSTPKGVGADPSDVAAVAAAFGRNSPRVSTSNQDPSKALPATPQQPGSPEAPRTPSMGGGLKIGKGPPPASPPPEEVQFDFNKFLEQLRHKSAQPVGEYVKR